jgi:hypothetical protein
MFTSGASQVVVTVTSMLSASITSLAVPVAIAGPIAMFVFVTAITSLAAVAIIVVVGRGFDVAGGGGIEESLYIES